MEEPSGLAWKRLKRSNTAKDPLIEKLCLVCGLCCNGVIFADVKLRPGDDAQRLRSAGLPVTRPRSSRRPPCMDQPCAALEGCRCQVYADRPQYCRQFECALLKSVIAGRNSPAQALRIIRSANRRADKVRDLLRALGDKHEASALSVRFRKTAKRLQAAEPDAEAADTYGQLTLAFHDLNLLLGDAFYP